MIVIRSDAIALVLRWRGEEEDDRSDTTPILQATRHLRALFPALGRTGSAVPGVLQGRPGVSAPPVSEAEGIWYLRKMRQAPAAKNECALR